MVLRKDQLDKANKDTHHKLLPEDFQVSCKVFITSVFYESFFCFPVFDEICSHYGVLSVRNSVQYYEHQNKFVSYFPVYYSISILRVFAGMEIAHHSFRKNKKYV